MHKKITKMQLIRYRIMKKKAGFDIFRFGKPRVANQTPGIDSLRNFTSIIYFWKIFFYQSKPLVAINAKKSFFSKKMAMKSKTVVETPKNFFLSWNFGYSLFFGWLPCQNLSEIGDLQFTYVKKLHGIAPMFLVKLETIEALLMNAALFVWLVLS